MLFHYGEAWAKIDGMMDLCELYLETSLQAILQYLFMIIYPTRIASRAQMFSLTKSCIMCLIGWTKIFLPAKLWNDQERSTIRKGRNLLWAGCLLSLIVGFHVSNVVPVGISLFPRQGVNNFSFVILHSSINQELIIGGFALIFLYSILSCIFMCNNSFLKSRQTQMKCLLLSIYFLLLFVFLSSLSFPNWNNLFWGGKVTLIAILMILPWLSIFFLYVSFIVTKLHDIFNLEVIEAKQNCFLRHLPFITINCLIHICLLSPSLPFL